ncbi:MAG: hypothetical protein B7X04_01025 [Parcubacteria group bacterium 21-54-25]|nr:MAG: hypothetical protein B7X04_01025 [Parcubacteria group bacterium 21-54-25]HQU07813.1 hypothetical protein [Candidatus Paceibacterota bacterium]
MNMQSKWVRGGIGVATVAVVGVFLYVVLAGKPARAPVSVPPIGGTGVGSGVPIVGVGGHCGGFIRNAPLCGPGLHCQLTVSRPDTGGVCVVDTATSTGSGVGGIAPFHSGVRGVVTLGPTCPVAHNPPLASCADKPYQTTVTAARTGSTRVFATEKTSVAGVFLFSLPPGSYTLSAKSGTPFPRCSSTDIVVNPSGYATTTISCDTGIR